MDERHLDAIADADTYPYWYEDVDEPDSNPTLVRTESCDLCIIGGGYTGLGVAVSRFGAEVMLDLIDGRRTRATAT